MEKTSKSINLKVTGLKSLFIVFGIICYSIGLKWFVYPANVLPGGFTGLSVLLQKLINNSTHILIPLTVYNVALNFIPALISYKTVGKRFTVLSFAIMFLFTFVADNIPGVNLSDSQLINSMFGGIICGFGASIWFRCGVSGGGTDFLALSASSKYQIKPFGYVMAFNISLILIQGLLFGWDYAFYSIIYQYVYTQTINTCYRHYEARTIFIVTNKPNDISKMLITKTGHSATVFTGIGSFSRGEKHMLYTVVTQPEVRRITNIVRSCDPEAFVNIMKSNEVQGNFKYLSVEQDVLDLD